MPGASSLPMAIDHTAFPEIIDAILNDSARDALLSFRGASSYYLEKINAQLFKHVCIVCVDSKPIDNTSELQRHTFLLLDVDGERLPISHFTVDEIDDDNETPKAHWRGRHRGMTKHIVVKLLHYVQVVDSPITFPRCNNVDMPNLRVTRVYDEDTEELPWSYYQPPADTIVMWASQLPLAPPVYDNDPSLVFHHVIRHVVINVSIGEACRDADPFSDFKASWRLPKVIIIVTPKSPISLYDWSFVSQNLIRFLKVAGQGRTESAVQIVGLAEALRQTYSLLVPAIDLEAMTAGSLYDLMKGCHWLVALLGNEPEAHVPILLRELFETLEQFSVPCMELPDYKKTLTTDEIATQLIPNSFIEL
ncbi:uncharacterized protein LOC62_03G003899 [Vanrija pseudolonga]|uniref:Uncharacterized protein n=1 Tax=Vanrija pseudolonga TaxID=143232 RepID=A0AAF0Y5C5_9TREE|nr:hypothetical protein LOC62_03G003899 [Vanrija pseudolonga]